jgi:hypothetical protein
MASKLLLFNTEMSHIIESKDFGRINTLYTYQDDFAEQIDAISLSQIKRMKTEEIGSRNMLLIATILHEEKESFSFTLSNWLK